MSKKILIYTQECVMGLAGGAERAFVDMANALTQRGYEVLAVCSGEKDGLPFYPLDKRVRFINLYNENLDEVKLADKKDNHYEEFLYKKFLDKEAFSESKEFSDKFEKFLEREKPDLIICHFMHLYRQISYCKDYDIPTIVMMHTYPDIFFNFFGKKYFPINRLVLNKVDLVQVMFESHIKSISKYYFGKVKVIANAVEALKSTVNADLLKEKDEYTILNISRFDKFKRQDLLIEAFALIAGKYPNWQVHFYGQFDPPERVEYINELIKKHNLESQIKYMGVTDSPLEVMQNSDIFVLPSDFEGFSLATAEAMSVGLPCIGFKECNGLNDLILDNKTGFLTEKAPQDLAQKIETLINDRDLRFKFGQNGKERVKEFSPDIIWGKWQDAIEELLSKKKTNTFKKQIVMLILYILLSFKALGRLLKK